MEALHDLYLESWTREHWAELHRVAAREAQVKSLCSCRVGLDGWRKAMALAGRLLIELGGRLEAVGRAPLPATR